MELSERIPRGNVDTIAVWETLDVQPQLVSKGNPSTQGRKVIMTKRWSYPRGTDSGKKLHVKGALRDISPHWKFKG